MKRYILVLVLMLSLSSLAFAIESINGGIGIEFQLVSDSIKVLQVIEKSPAAYCLKANDQVIAVDNIAIAGKTQEQVQNLIMGEIGTSLELKVKRNNQIIDCQLKRARIRYYQQNTKLYNAKPVVITANNNLVRVPNISRDKQIFLENIQLTDINSFGETDNIISAGEGLYVNFDLKNNTNREFKAVNISLRSDSELVAIKDKEQKTFIPLLKANESFKYNLYDLYAYISENITNNITANLFVEINHEQGNAIVPIQITIQPSIYKIESNDLLDILKSRSLNVINISQDLKIDLSKKQFSKAKIIFFNNKREKIAVLETSNSDANFDFIGFSGEKMKQGLHFYILELDGKIAHKGILLVVEKSSGENKLEF